MKYLLAMSLFVSSLTYARTNTRIEKVLDSIQGEHQLDMGNLHSNAFEICGLVKVQRTSAGQFRVCMDDRRGSFESCTDLTWTNHVSEHGSRIKNHIALVSANGSESVIRLKNTHRYEGNHQSPPGGHHSDIKIVAEDGLIKEFEYKSVSFTTHLSLIDSQWSKSTVHCVK